MSDWWALVLVFLGGALPWLEAVVVVPGGIVAGLPVVPVVLAATAGNLATVAVAAWLGEQLRVRFTRWRQRRSAARHDEETAARVEDGRRRRQARVERWMARGGMPALAGLAPVIGTQFVAAAVVAAGVPATRSFLWIGAGTTVWAVLAAVATLGGFEVLGIG